jgi:regulator of RNase E activity RraA
VALLRPGELMKFTAAMFIATALHAQFFVPGREEMLRLTPQNPFGRFEDGRPKVPDALLEKVRTLSVDDVYEALRVRKYTNQFAGGFEILRPGVKLVGRAFTAQYLPFRPDLDDALQAAGKLKGVGPRTTNKTIDLLQAGDVPVIDLMGAAPGNNYGGDNLHAALYGITKTGAVVEGTIRDLEGMHEFPTQIYYRQARPEAVADVSVLGINIPVRIGRAVVLPGDVVLGDRTGVVFIPPHLLEEILRENKK